MALKFNQQTNQWEDDENSAATEMLQEKTSPQYPMSPMDPMKDVSPILSALLSPEGIRRPLYNYNESPKDNMLLGSVFAQPVEATSEEIMDSRIPTPEIAQPEPIPSTVKKVSTQKPAISEKSISTPIHLEQPQEILALEQKQEESDFLKELLDAQKRKNDQLQGLALLEAGDRIGTAIAGSGRLDYEKGKFDSLKAMAGQDLQDVVQKQDLTQKEERYKLDMEKAKLQMADEKAKSDPKSEISAVARASVVDSLNKIGRTDLAKMVSANMSSKQIEDIFGQYNLNNMMQAFDAQQNRLELAKMRAEEKTSLAKDKSSKEKDDFITKRYDKVIQSKDYQAMAKISQARNLIKDALNNPSGIKDIGALYSLIKLYDPESVVRESEIKLTDSARSIWNKAASMASKAGSNPRVLDKTILKAMNEAADRIYAESAQQYQMKLKPVLDQAKKRGIDESEFSMIDPLYDQMKAVDKPKQIEYNVDQDALAAELKKRGL